MKLPSLNEFSLWLEPEGKDLIRIKKFTTEIQKISGSPKFIPHVTLLGGLKATKKEIESNLKKL